MIYLAQAVRTVLRRLRPDWPVAATAAVTVLVGTVQLAAVPIYTDAVTVGALRRILADAAADEATLDVRLATSAEAYGVADDVVTEAIAEATAGPGAEVSRRIRSSSFALGERGEADRVDLVVLATIEGIERHATVVDGAWPQPGTTTPRVPAALEAGVADDLGLAVGDVLELRGRRNDSEVSVEIVGRYRIDDRTSRFWAGDELLLAGSTSGRLFRTFGPLVVTEASMRSAPTGRLGADWHVEPRLDRLTVAGIDDLRRSVTRLEDRLDSRLAATPAGATGTVSDADVTTRLPALLADTRRSLTVTRSGVYAVVLQLGVLSGLALAITGALLVDTRRREAEVLRARGAGRTHLVVLSIVEACVLVLPAAAAGPWVAAGLVKGLGATGPLAGIGLTLEPSVGSAAYATVALVAVAMVGVLAWPAVRADGAIRLGGDTRHRDRAMVSRSGVDLALLALMVLAFWQLSVLGTQRAAWIGTRFSVDPVLIAAPALALLAGAVTGLRVLPLLARAGERQVDTSRSPAVALTGWQLARRPSSHGRPGFLLVMAFGIGVFTATYSATWHESQVDQATFETGADLRVQPNRRTGDSITDLHLVAAHEGLPGVAASMPVARMLGALPGSERTGRFLLLDAARAPQVVQIRDDLATDFPSLIEALVGARPDVQGIELPGEPERLALEVAVDEAHVETADGELLPAVFQGHLTLTLRDGNDLVHRLELGDVRPGTQFLETELTALDGPSLLPAHPLSIIEVGLRAPVPAPPSRRVTLELRRLSVGSSAGPSTQVSLGAGSVRWTAASEVSSGLRSQQSVAVGGPSPDGGLVLAIETGATARQSLASFRVRPGPAPSRSAIPIVVSRSWLESTRRHVGERFTVPTLLRGAVLQVVGVVEGFPTVDPNVDDVAVLDLPTVQLLDHAAGRPPRPVDEHWLEVTTGTSEDAVAASLTAEPFDSVSVAARERRTDEMRTDPAALATIAAYTVGFVAAAVFAVVVFAVTAVMAARDRRGEFALLRAMGLSPRQLALWQVAEHVILVTTSLVLGVAIGLALSAVSLPLVSVGQLGEPVVPATRPVYPWATLTAVELAPLLALVAIVAVLVGRLQRLPMAELLRMGED